LPSGVIVALIDLSGLPHAAARDALVSLARADRLGALIGRAVVRLPPGSGTDFTGSWSCDDSADGARACAWAFDLAVEVDAALLVMTGGVLPSAEMVSLLLEAFDLDPLFGFAVPRIVSAETHRLLLSRPFGPSTDTAPLCVLASLPDYQVTTECVAPLFLIRREVVGNLAIRGSEAADLWPTLAAYAVRTRRAGFRTVVCNRAIASFDAPAGGAEWGCSAGSLVTLRHAWPELARVEDEHELSLERSAEHVLAAAFDRPRSLLVDARNLTPIVNGTSLVILHICDALHRARPDADTTLWVHSNSAQVYGLEQRYPAWRIITATPVERHAAALRLTQPWYHSDLNLLGRFAAVNTYWMLDTIAWDVVYCAPPDLDAVWQRMAAEADAVFFISEFSRARFEHRFTAGPGVRLIACPLSLDASDYVTPVAKAPLTERYWLVVGNRYDHKHIAPTIDLLSRAFPRQPMVVLGDRDQPRTDWIIRFDSGSVDNDAMQALYAHAEALIFPSFSEGFGLPIVQGLAYDRTVVARASPLVSELANRYRGPGRLVTFDSERSLVQHLERLSRGQPIESVATVTDRTDRWTWDSAAATLLAHIEELVAVCPSPQIAKRVGLTRGLTHPHRRA
jgi:glycosyltransferase involved in cell wall biosynthesis